MRNESEIFDLVLNIAKNDDRVRNEHKSDRLRIPLLDKYQCLPPIPPPTKEDYWDENEGKRLC